MPNRPKRRSPADVLNALARAEHDAREAVRRKRRRAAKRHPKRVDAYDWPEHLQHRLQRGLA